jgi:hypothetical protein
METIDLAGSWDTTGSMRTALTQVARNFKGMASYLFDALPTFRMAGFAHGDVCDAPNVIRKIDFTNDKRTILDFIENVPYTGGCNQGARYEQIFKEARSLSWTSGRNKALVFVGDTYPHDGGEDDRPGTCECYSSQYGHERIDWRNELDLLVEAGIKVYPMQALRHLNNTDWFYNEVAERAGTVKLEIDQFADMTDTIMAVCMKTGDRLGDFETYLGRRGNVSEGIRENLGRLTGRAYSRKKGNYGGLVPVPRSRFQILVVEEDTPIKDFVTENDLYFQIGRGFYEFTKPVLLRENNEVVVQDRLNGEMFSGEAARKLLGIPLGQREKIRPDNTGRWRYFIQSTSPNRKLLANTRFLYEVD